MHDRQGPVPLSDEIASFIRRAGIGSGSRNREIFAAWTAALGTPLAPRAVPVSFRDGELVVEVESSALHHELAGFTGERYRARANQILGTERVRRIRYELKR